MAFVQKTEYDMKMFGIVVNVANNPVAKLMYYLDCLCTVVDYNENGIDRYRKYADWRNMSNEEHKVIFCLAASLSPEQFEKRVFFQDDRLCPESTNQFYEIGQIKHQFLIVPSVVIGGQQRAVRKIMAYKKSWMTANYYEPLKELQNELQRRRMGRHITACSIS